MTKPFTENPESYGTIKQYDHLTTFGEPKPLTGSMTCQGFCRRCGMEWDGMTQHNCINQQTNKEE